MKKIPWHFIAAFMVASFIFYSSPVFAQTAGEARIILSYMALHGKKPDSRELTKWGQRNFRNMKEAHDAIKAELNASSNYDDSKSYAKRMMIIKCYRDALAYNPSIDEVKYWLPRTDSYTALFDNHMNYANNIYDDVIKNAHKNAVYRDPTPFEISYWKDKTKNKKIPAYIIEGYIKTHKNKSGGGYKLKGLNDPLGDLWASFINYFIVPPIVANEAITIGLPPANLAGNFEEIQAHLVAAGGGNLVAAGGGNILSHNGAALVAAGGGNLVAAGGGN